MLPIRTARAAVPFAFAAVLAAAAQQPPVPPPAVPPAVVPSAAVATPAPAPQDTARPEPAAPRFPRLGYPKDKEFVVAEVDGAPLSLEQLVLHIDQRHYPGFREFAARDAGQLLFTSDLIAPWVSQFADITALLAEAKTRGLEP